MIDQLIIINPQTTFMSINIFNPIGALPLILSSYHKYMFENIHDYQFFKPISCNYYIQSIGPNPK